MAECESSAESAQPSAEPDSLKLSELFERSWRALDELDSTQEPLASHAVQERVQRAIRGLESASRRVAQLELFSRNEELEEVCTSELKYLLLPALLGGLTLKQTSRERRLEILQTARAYFVDYLQRCKNYDVSQFNMPRSCVEAEAESAHPTAAPGLGQPNLVAMAAHRQAKIERYRQKKEVETQLEAVKRAVDGGQADEETSRRFYLLHLRRWISLSLEEVESIDQELPILKNMGTLKNTPRPPPQPSRPPMKPFILTKDAVQRLSRHFQEAPEKYWDMIRCLQLDYNEPLKNGLIHMRRCLGRATLVCPP
ncbi:immunoglobulin-binding protein 1 isoform X2 [Boleophthalmus pectinirostris]|uniref:immunoglobulin-binding protein 1 isoform X2 n=1 Tax=Boleophthalmus pectinirostris TaxID=150288 RepID=UPI002430CC33|nr:immunoglobulin-binding protein 1 isoform X2 [Boleophthalmus pectinirostris]